MTTSSHCTSQVAIYVPLEPLAPKPLATLSKNAPKEGLEGVPQASSGSKTWQILARHPASRLIPVFIGLHSNFVGPHGLSGVKNTRGASTEVDNLLNDLYEHVLATQLVIICPNQSRI